LKILKEGIDVDKFFEYVKGADKRALLLDYDGTLAPFKVDRNEAVPYPGIREMLERMISECNIRLVIISGRWMGDLIPLLGLKELPEIWGSHGWERLMPDRKYQIAQPDKRSLQGIADAESWILEEKLSKYCERKHYSLALHLRGVEPSEGAAIKEKTLEKWSGIANQSGLSIQEFDGGIELRSPELNKGHAVETILGEMGEGTVAAYLGDDHTDEDAFTVLEGRGLAVLVREEIRETNAHLWIKPPEELILFLERWIDICSTKR
jgi:trehalose-phosphatase